MSTLYLRPPPDRPSQHYTVWIAFTDSLGRRQQRSTKIRLSSVKVKNGSVVWPQNVLVFQQQLDAEIVLGVWGMQSRRDTKKMGMSEAFDVFIKCKRRASSTVKLHELSFKKLKEKIGDLPLLQVTEAVLTQWRDIALLEDGEQNTACWMRHLSAYFHFCVEQGWLKKTPLTRNIKVVAPHMPVVVFAEEQIDGAFAWLLKHKGRHAVDQLRFLLLTGWRVGDCCRLTKDMIDMDRRCISHYIGKQKRHTEYPVDETLYEFLVSLPQLPGPRVFKYQVNTLDHYFKEALRAHAKGLGLPLNEYLRVHTLRKQFAYNCHRNGVPIEECARLLGHTNITTTLRYYQYWDTGKLRDSLAKSRQVTTKSLQPKKKL